MRTPDGSCATILFWSKFQNFTISPSKNFLGSSKLTIFACLPSCTSRDYFKFECGYLLGIAGCIFEPKIFGLGGPSSDSDGGGGCGSPPPVLCKVSDRPCLIGLTWIQNVGQVPRWHIGPHPLLL